MMSDESYEQNDLKVPENMDSNPTGKVHHHRKRKKQYFNTIRQQMEFYFSDANLTKDRFLKKLLATDPCE